MPGPDYHLQAFVRLVEQIMASGLTKKDAHHAVEVALSNENARERPPDTDTKASEEKVRRA